MDWRNIWEGGLFGGMDQRIDRMDGLEEQKGGRDGLEGRIGGMGPAGWGRTVWRHGLMV
jgi:hypothetical protein